MQKNRSSVFINRKSKIEYNNGAIFNLLRLTTNSFLIFNFSLNS